MLNKEMVLNVTKYISENDYMAKFYIENNIEQLITYYKNEIPQKKAYRLWNFSDEKIIDLINDKNIIIEDTKFLSYYGKFGNTKNMFEFLDFVDINKIFYIIEESNGNFYSIYDILESIDRDTYSNADLKLIDQTIHDYRDENEYIKFNINKNKLSINNIYSLIIHERFSKILDYPEYKILKHGFCHYKITNNFINYLKNHKLFQKLIQDKEYLEYEKLSYFDDYYDNNYEDFLKEYQEQEELIEKKKNLNKYNNMNSIKFNKSTDKSNE